MQDKVLKLMTAICLLLNMSIAFSAEEKIEISVKKSDTIQDSRGGLPATKEGPFSFLLNGMRQAITAELSKNELNSEIFWKKIEDKKISDADEINLFRPYFNRFNIVMDKSDANSQKVVEAPGTEQFLKATFSYEFDAEKIKKFFLETMADAHDEKNKTIYIIPDINITQDMNWMDLGVSKQENFSGVIIDSWKKWAQTQFKSFTDVVVLEKDFLEKSDQLNAESVTLKWNSTIKKAEVFQDRKSARFEVSAQFVLVNTRSNQSLLAFDFPLQKKEVSITSPKDLSSVLASLVFNLLNSQTVKINSALELNRATSTLSIVDIKLTGKHGLFDITQINSMLSERFKEFALTSEMKSYSMDSSVISIKSTLNQQALYSLFMKDGGKYIFNEQKILLFSPETKVFAIISK